MHPGQEHGAAQEVQGADLVGHGHLVGDHRGPQDDRQIHCHQPGIGGARLGGARGGGDGGDGARGVQSRRRERGRRNRWRAHGWGARRARGRNRRGRRGRRRPAEPGPVLPVRIGLGPRCVGDRCALGPGRGGPAPDLLPAPVLDLLLGRGGVVLPASRGGIGAALGADQDVAGAVAVGAVRADAPHEQAGQGQQEPGGPPPALVPDQRAPVDVGVEKSGRGAQGARAGPLDEPQEVLPGGARVVVDGQGDDLVHRGAPGRGPLGRPRVGEDDQARGLLRAEQLGGELVPGAGGAAVERLSGQDGLLPHDAGQHRSADHGQAALVLLDRGVHAADHADAGAHPPVAVEDDRDGEGWGAHAVASVGLVGMGGAARSPERRSRTSVR